MDTRPPQPPPRRSRFRDARQADADGLVAVGGLLEPEWLVDAYRHGVFPWPIEADEPMLWWSPDPRGVMPLDGLRVSRRLRRTLRSDRCRVTCNADFDGVIHGCATAPDRAGKTWIFPEMQKAYRRLHEVGIAHSVETWATGADGQARLVGGVYGVAIGGLFAGESMFHYQTDASKVALATLVVHLAARGYRLFDVQQRTEHTARLGVVDLPRSEYLDRLAAAIDLPVTFGDRLEGAPW